MDNNEIENGVVDTELELEGGNNETRTYELGFHIDPELPQEEVKKTYQGIRESIAKNGEVVAEGEPERIPLAYTISRMETTGRRDFQSAYFAWVAYDATGEGHEAVLEMARGESRIVRFIDLKTTHEAAKHAAEMHEMMFRAVEEGETPQGEEESPEAELDAALKDAGV